MNVIRDIETLERVCSTLQLLLDVRLRAFQTLVVWRGIWTIALKDEQDTDIINLVLFYYFSSNLLKKAELASKSAVIIFINRSGSTYFVMIEIISSNRGFNYRTFSSKLEKTFKSWK